MSDLDQIREAISRQAMWSPLPTRIRAGLAAAGWVEARRLEDPQPRGMWAAFVGLELELDQTLPKNVFVLELTSGQTDWFCFSEDGSQLTCYRGLEWPGGIQ